MSVGYVGKYYVPCHRCIRTFGEYIDGEGVFYLLCKDCDSNLIGEWILLKKRKDKIGKKIMD